MPHPHQPCILTERQEIFCRHVARGASGAAAARSAGYAPGNAAQQGSNLLQQPHVRARIEALRIRREGNRQAAIAEITDTLRLLMRRAIKAGDHRAAIRCLEVEARLMGLYPDRQTHAFAGADPLLDSIDGRGAGMIPDRLFDEWDEEEPTPTNAEESPHLPMSSSQAEAAPPNCLAGLEPAPSCGRAPEAQAEAAVCAEDDTPRAGGDRSGMDAGSSPARQAGGAEEAGLIEPADHDGFAPDFDPVQARIRRVTRQQNAEDARLAAQCPPRATSPEAPEEARSPWPQLRAYFANRHGWDNAWADEAWTPPDWLAHVEVRDSRA